MKWRRTFLVAVLSTALFGLGLGCGPDDENNESNLPNNMSDGGMDAGDSTTDGDMGDADATTEDTDEGDGVVGQSCDARPEDLGTLALGDSLDLDRPFRVRPDDTSSSCAEPESRAGVYVFEFQVEETSKVQLGLFASAASSPTLEMRAGECLERGTPEFCGDEPSRTGVAEPGRSYYVFIQGAADSEASDFRITFDVSAAVCGPSDEVCTSGAQQTCDQGNQIITRNCVEECGASSACTGDVCSNAVPVDISTTTSFTYNGDQYAYDNDWNALDRGNCALDESAPGGDTPNADLFFEITGHAQGDRLVFNAENSQTNFGFYILDSCDAAGCIDAGAAADPLAPNEFTWRATSANTIYVVAEVLGPRRDRTIEITISKQ